MSDKPKKWRHDELAADLAQYLRETRNLVAWEDMQLGPAGSPRPDVYAIPRSYANFRPLAYECKVSVSDFRADVTKGKWHSYLQYACGVVFAAPSGLISKADLPEGCGLIQRSEAGWRMAKGPTMQPLDNMPRDAWLKLLMDGVERESKRAQVAARCDNQYQAEHRAITALRKRVGDEVAELVQQALHARTRLESAIERDAEQRRAVNEGTERYIRDHRERLERQAARLSSEQRDLAEELGLASDATMRELIDAIRIARSRLGEDNEVQMLRRHFEEVARLTDLSLRELPAPGVQPQGMHRRRRAGL